jgi:hypothetical protein
MGKIAGGGGKDAGGEALFFSEARDGETAPDLGKGGVAGSNFVFRHEGASGREKALDCSRALNGVEDGI